MQSTLPSPEQVLALVTDFYCSLTNKKDIHQIVADIRHFVMHRDSISNKEYVAKLLVDYFLKLQVRLKTKTQQQWDTTFELSTARDRACISLSKFPNKYSYRHAMKKIKQCQFLNRSFEVEVTDTQYSEYDEICIEEDVKIKTDFFFKWCLYVRHAKAFRQLKQKDIQNLKISQTFNSFGIKFNYFIAWKQFCKKKRMMKQKQDLLKNKSNDRLALKCITKIQEITSIISIENKLSETVIDKLISCRKKETFKRLADNKLKNKLRTRKLGKNKNLMFFFFLREMIGNRKPNMSRSFVAKREECRIEENQILRKKSFRLLKNLFVLKQEKIKKVRQFRQATFLTKWRSFLSSKNDLVNKKIAVTSYLSQKRKKIAFIIFSFSHLTHENQCKGLQNMLSDGSCKETTEGTLNQVNLKKQMRTKWLVCCKNLQTIRKKHLYQRLSKIRSDIGIKMQKFQKMGRLFKKRLFTHYANYKINSAKTQEYFNELDANREMKMMKRSLKKWKQLKRYNKKQVQVLQKVNNLHILSTKIQFWSKFRRQSHQKQCIEEISDKIISIINRITFMKIAGRTVRINKEVEKFKAIKDRKSVRYLFNMLVANIQYKNKLSHQILINHGKACKAILIKRLKLAHDHKQNREKIVYALEKSRKKQFLAEITNMVSEKTLTQQKYEYLGKQLFINYLVRSVCRTTEKSIKLEEKCLELASFLKNNSESQFIKNFKKMIHQKEKQQEKSYQAVKNIASKGIKLIKKRIQQQKQYNCLISKKLSVLKQRKSNCLRDLLYENREKKLREFYQHSKTLQGIDKFRKTMSSDLKMSQNLKKLEDQIASHEIHQFYKFMKLNRDEMKAKEAKLQQYISEKIKEDKKKFITFIKENKENIQNLENLIKKKKHKHLSELMTTTFKGKFYRVKFNCSLKFYAKNLLKKGFKTMKRIHLKTKHKENIMKLDKTSSIRMEKSIDKSSKSHTLSQQVQKFNMRRSKQIMMRAL